MLSLLMSLFTMREKRQLLLWVFVALGAGLVWLLIVRFWYIAVALAVIGAVIFRCRPPTS